MAIVQVTTAAQLAEVRALFEEYWQSFGFTPCFQNFSSDMHQIGRDDLIPEVREAQAHIALLRAGAGLEMSNWLVFPDGHMLLWRYRPLRRPRSTFSPQDESGLLKWKSVDFLSSKPCAQDTFLRCPGSEVSPEGILVAPK